MRSFVRLDLSHRVKDIAAVLDPARPFAFQPPVRERTGAFKPELLGGFGGGKVVGGHTGASLCRATMHFFII